ncbi:MAG TPA: hypothetical protein PLQ61_06740 [Bacteroidales bacterium]|nr:hypothetical protein [Petrotogaceae bacterium]HQJ20873.1 hypothetical protein [Bacteroidales bacterium]
MKLSDLKPDKSNANKGTDKGREMLEISLQKYGAGRSILIDKAGRIIAGNKTVEQAKNLNMDDVIVVPSDGSKIVAVQRTDLDLEKDAKARELAYADNRIAEIDLKWDYDQILKDAEVIPIDEWFSEEELEGLKGEPGACKKKYTIHLSNHSGYNDNAAPDIETLKLAYRLESCCFIERKKAIELYSGRQVLTYWYNRLFKEVITNDKQKFDNINHDYNLIAKKFIKTELKNHLDFDFIDFDDEGCPGVEIQCFFEVIKNKKEPFILAVTDGIGSVLQINGKLNLYKFYKIGENKVIKTDGSQYQDCINYIPQLIDILCKEYNFKNKLLSMYKKSSGRANYFTFLIDKLI